MNWKSIEDKPQNWETLQQILHQCTSDNDNNIEENVIHSKDWQNDKVFYHFIHHLQNSKFTDPSIIFKDVFGEHTFHEWNSGYDGMMKKKNQPSNPNKKNGPSRKHLIHEQKEHEIIVRELGNIRFDTRTWYPITSRSQSLDSFFHLSVVEWLFFLFPRSLKKQASTPGISDNHKRVMLDAYLSYLHMFRDDLLHNKMMIPEFRVFFEKVDTWLEETWKEYGPNPFELLFKFPKLMMTTYASKRRGGMGLYPEQKRFLKKMVDAVVFNQPLLIGDRRPPGTGKTFMAIPLTQKIKALKRNKFVLFTCANDLVRMDVARTALLGNNIHLWMGRQNQTADGISFLIRPHKTCFPNVWKKVYKKEDKEKVSSIEDQFHYYENATNNSPDIIVCDVPTALEILKIKELRERTIAYIDEVIFDHEYQPEIIKLLPYVPPHTVFMSSILPSFRRIPGYTESFCERYKTDPERSLVEIESKEHACISCAVIDENGYLVMPHHYSPFGEIPFLIEKMKMDPLVARLYTPYHVYHMVDECCGSWFDQNPSHPFRFEVYFTHLHHVNHQRIRQYIMDLFGYIHQHNEREIYQTFQEYRRKELSVEKIDRTKILTSQSFCFQGKTLYITSNEFLNAQYHEASQLLLEGAPKWDVLQKQIKVQGEQIEREIKQLQKANSSKDAKLSRMKMEREVAGLREEMAGTTKCVWPPQFFVNSKEHFVRFHQSSDKNIKDLTIPPKFEAGWIQIDQDEESVFDDWTVSLLHCGVGSYQNQTMTEYQRSMMIKNFTKLNFIFSGRELVFGTNVEGLTNLFIDKEFGHSKPRSYLYQLMGRTGRMGYSYEAQVVVNSNKTLEKIMNLIQDDDQEDVCCTIDNVRVLS